MCRARPAEQHKNAHTRPLSAISRDAHFLGGTAFSSSNASVQNKREERSRHARARACSLEERHLGTRLSCLEWGNQAPSTSRADNSRASPRAVTHFPQLSSSRWDVLHLRRVRGVPEAQVVHTLIGGSQQRSQEPKVVRHHLGAGGGEKGRKGGGVYSGPARYMRHSRMRGRTTSH